MKPNHPRPWSVYPVRVGMRVAECQIRDANGAVLFVSASYGTHANAPLDSATKIRLARQLVRAVNQEKRT